MQKMEVRYSFRQERVTLNGKRFMILKFRSMIVDAEKDGDRIQPERKMTELQKWEI